MKLAKKISDTPLPNEEYNTFIARVAYGVKDDYDFSANLAENISTLQNSIIVFRLSVVDAIFFRELLKTNVLPNWATISFDEQKQLVAYFIYPTGTDLNLYYTPEEQYQLWQELAHITKSSREARIEQMRSKVSYYITMIEACDFFNAVESLIPRYEQANRPDLQCFIQGTAYPPLGIDYTTNGFPSKTYFSVERQDLLLNILIYGLY